MASMKQLARIMRQNAPMQTRLQSSVHSAERRADFRAVFRAEKMAAVQNELQSLVQ